MQALAITRRDASPAVVDVLDREPGPGEVRVGVEAASINGYDLAVAAGYVWDHMPHTFPVVIGRDFAGSVEAVGEGVEDVAAGDPVAGVITALELGPGPVAERITVDAASVVPRPDAVTAVQAAAVGLAGIAALDLIDALNPGSGDTVLVSGATGGVGAFAVELAAARGAHVIATARAGEATEFVRSLGARDSADFTEDLTAAVRAIAPNGVTKVVHAAGDPVVLGALLVSGGHLASVVGATPEQVGRVDVSVTGVLAAYTPDRLATLLEQVAGGRLHVPVAATYPLASATEALSAFGSGKLGKIVVTP
jgi:NADPH:quinone reductase-like Zn-dependent oxidoreductase